MRVLVCGAREGINQNQVTVVLDALRPKWPLDIEIGEGEAVGVDRFAKQWAKERGHAVREFPVEPAVDGGRDDAPKRRNKRMLDLFEPHICVAFIGRSGGTKHMSNIAHRAGVTVLEVEFLPDGTAEIHQWPDAPNAQRQAYDC